MKEENMKKGLMHLKDVPDFAEEILKQLCRIHNNFITQESGAAFFEMGVLVESLAQVVREGEKS